MNPRCTHYNFNTCAALLQQRGRFERALPPTYDDNALAGEPAEIPVLRSV
jgi:hypothetical protein